MCNKIQILVHINPSMNAGVRVSRDGVCTPPLYPEGPHPGLKTGVSLSSRDFKKKQNNQVIFNSLFDPKLAISN